MKTKIKIPVLLKIGDIVKFKSGIGHDVTKNHIVEKIETFDLVRYFKKSADDLLMHPVVMKGRQQVVKFQDLPNEYNAAWLDIEQEDREIDLPF